jgi:hypothetical protein
VGTIYNALKMDFPRFIITFFLPDRLAFKKEQDEELNWAKDEFEYKMTKTSHFIVSK